MGSDLDTFTGKFGVTLHRLKLIPDGDRLSPLYTAFKVFINGKEVGYCTNYEFNCNVNGDFFANVFPDAIPADGIITFHHGEEEDG